MSGLIKHQFDGPFIPVNRIKKDKPIKKKRPEPKVFICHKNHKKLKNLGILCDQKVIIEIGIFNVISFYDEQIKLRRIISLPPKLMNKFKEVK